MVDVKKRRVGHPVDLGAVTLDQLYSGPHPINKKKADDLQQLLCFIPPGYTFRLTAEAEEDD